jgi:hypothetical protein
MIAVRPAVASVLLGVRPYTLRQLLLCGELRLLHVDGRPKVGIGGIGVFSRRPAPQVPLPSVSSRVASRADDQKVKAGTLAGPAFDRNP